MASKSAQPEPEKAEVIEEALDDLDKALDRVKVLYEQYFLGIQKQPPQFLHTDVERKLRDLAQLQIRNTALRYRFATLQQKFGAYHTYWRRTLREIEAGRYHRSLSKVTRHAAATGAEIPHEILAAMPRRMREQVRRDREAQLALQRRRGGSLDDAGSILDTEVDRDAGRPARAPAGGAHALDETDAELDLDALLRAVEADVDAAASAAAPPPGRPPPGRPPTGQPVAARQTPPAGTPIPRPPPIPAGARLTPATGTPIPRPPPIPAAARLTPATGTPVPPPPGMTEAEVNALYASYVQARARIGQPPGPGAYGKLMQTIHAQAPKIMEQYRAKGVDFSVVVQGDQVIIRAKPKM